MASPSPRGWGLGGGVNVNGFCWMLPPPPPPSHKGRGRRLAGIDFRWWLNRQTTAGDIHLRHGDAGERDQQWRRVLARDLQARARTVVVHRTDRADATSRSITRRQPHQIRQIELVL